MAQFTTKVVPRIGDIGVSKSLIYNIYTYKIKSWFTGSQVGKLLSLARILFYFYIFIVYRSIKYLQSKYLSNSWYYIVLYDDKQWIVYKKDRRENYIYIYIITIMNRR